MRLLGLRAVNFVKQLDDPAGGIAGDGVEDCLPVAPGRDEPVLAKQRKMLRDCGFALAGIRRADPLTFHPRAAGT